MPKIMRECNSAKNMNVINKKIMQDTASRLKNVKNT